jgi:pheromone a factor receptor
MAQQEIGVELPRWSIVFCVFGFFVFFGFADDVRKNYRYAFQSVVSDSAPADLLPEPVSTVQVTTELMGMLKLFLLLYLSLADYYLIYFRMKSKTIGSSGKIRPVLPLFVHKEILQRHSFDSFNDLSIGDVSGALTTINQHHEQQ